MEMFMHVSLDAKMKKFSSNFLSNNEFKMKMKKMKQKTTTTAASYQYLFLIFHVNVLFSLRFAFIDPECVRVLSGILRLSVWTFWRVKTSF